MKVIHEHEGRYTLNFAKGDEVMAGLVAFLKEKGISAGHITGLGAASALTLAYYNLETKEYEKHSFTEDVEVLSLTGNVGVKEENEIVVHLHGTFGRKD